MKKSNFSYRLSAIMLSFLMLFSSVGFSIDVHFCGGEIETIGFYGKADECDMMKKAEMQKQTHACCPSQKKVKTHCSKNTKKNSISKKSCCQNETFVLQSTDDGQTSNTFDLANVDLTFVALFVYNQLFNFEGEADLNNFNHYSPPLIPQDVIILHQVFLI